MHIAIDARVMNSPTGTVVERMLHYLQELDTENRYTILLDRKDAGFWQPRSPNFSVLLVDVPFHSFSEQTRLRRVLAKLAPDLIHFCMPQQPLLFYRGRKVTTFHDLTILRVRNPMKSALASLAKRSVGWMAFRLAAAESALIFTDSDYTRQDMVRTLNVPSDKMSVVYCAADIDPSALEPVEHPYRRFLLYVGRHSPYKNLLRLCDAHQQLLAAQPDLGLVFAGRINAEAEVTKSYCDARGYRNISFTGYLSNGQRDWLYKHAAAYVFPSLYEGFGLPGLEAMGYGAPVVSSNATCLPEIYGDAAVYFDPSDVGQMAGAISSLLEDGALRAAMIERGYERITHFSWRRMAEQTLEHYRAVMRARGARANRPGGS
jgi:glycosyltransferase involved in cell wall biosynthesis